MKRLGLLAAIAAAWMALAMGAGADFPPIAALPLSTSASAPAASVQAAEAADTLKVAMAAPQGIKVILKPLVRVEGDTVELMQIADFSGEDYALIEQLAHTSLAASPRVGKTLRLNRVSVERAIAKIASSRVGQISVEGALEVSIERHSMRINIELLRQEIVKRAKAQLPYESDQLIVSPIKQLPDEIVLPRGKLKFDCEFQYGNRMLGRTSFTGIFYVDGRIEKRITSSLNIDIESVVLQAVRTIGRGQPLQESDFRAVPWSQSKLPPGAIPSLGDGWDEVQTTRSIQVGQILIDSMIVRPPLIKRNDGLSLVIRRSGLTASATGVAKESGVKGDVIRVTNIGSGKEIFARVLDSQTAEVIF